MRNELKPCPFCGTEPTVHRSLVAYKADGKHPAGEYEESVSISCHDCGYEMSDEYREDVSKKWNTRTVPDVPELARYDLACDFDGKRYPYIIEVELGDYVRYDQVAGMLAAKDAFISELSRQLGMAETALDNQKEINANLMGDDEDKPRYTTKRLKHEIKKAVKEKLAQYEKQKPVGVIHQGVFYSTKDLEEYPEYSTGIKIYASPAPMESEN